MSEKAKVGLELMTAMQTIERRDAHISRLSEELRALKELEQAARGWIAEVQPGMHTNTATGFSDTRKALMAIDKLREHNDATLKRLQGKRGGLPGRASGN